MNHSCPFVLNRSVLYLMVLLAMNYYESIQSYLINKQNHLVPFSKKREADRKCYSTGSWPLFLLLSASLLHIQYRFHERISTACSFHVWITSTTSPQKYSTFAIPRDPHLYDNELSLTDFRQRFVLPTSDHSRPRYLCRKTTNFNCAARGRGLLVTKAARRLWTWPRDSAVAPDIIKDTPGISSLASKDTSLIVRRANTEALRGNAFRRKIKVIDMLLWNYKLLLPLSFD